MNFLRAVFRIYVTVKRISIALAHMLLGLTICGASLLLIYIGLWFGMLQSSAATLVVVILALVVAGFGLSRICEALPGIIPARTSDAPGRSRLGTRDDLRRSGLI
ncbi:hypothetical protein [Bradyrhizobium sp. STM 3809]|uniref:hypothetical protein n=1 Tax=Bradyrhizobium sp. STM 3809 TaxID=551936 RepID=UPI0002406542|nr:hypothetical protein [Bradyrhizobium sp. STM 3809]CCD97622.1 hypothetical protein BRAS3809_1160004 [Bradyrhizobium sp. STM 3809]